MEPMAESIAYDGLIEPLTVVADGDHFKVVNGARRYWAIRALFDCDAPVFDRERWRFSLARTLYRSLPCEIVPLN